MKTLHFVFALLLLCLAAFLPACEKETSVGAPPNNGSIDPTTYVAIGNSITAGFSSAALFESAQQYSFPNQIARQIGAPEFNQPLMPDPGTGTKITLQSLNPPTLVTGSVTQTAPSNASLAKPFNNLGLPGALLYDALDTTSISSRAAQRQNPFYLMVMRNQLAFGKNLIEQATKLKPTFITFWLGMNDVLVYAKSGGVQGTNIGYGGVPPQTLPTETVLFDTLYNQSLGLLKALNPNARIMVANIPDVTEMPLFTTVPYKVPMPGDPNTLLSIYYRNSDGTIKTATSSDRILLTAQSELAKGIGLTPNAPLSSLYVLDQSEITIAQNAVSAFNASIFRIAAKYNIPVVYMREFLHTLKTDKMRIAGETLSADFITGGVYSLDGVHFTAKGNALVANEFIRVMNFQFGANIPWIIPSTLPGIPQPAAKGGRPFAYSLDWNLPEYAFDGF